MGIQDKTQKKGLKYPAGMPITPLSKDNGDWQPVNAKGKMVEAH